MITGLIEQVLRRQDSLEARLARLESHELSRGLTLLTEQVLAAAVASVTLPSSGTLPSGYRALVIHSITRADNAVLYNSLLLRCNGDSGANYDYANHAGGGFVTAFAQTAAQLGDTTGANSPANVPAVAEILIPGYDRTVFYKAMNSNSGLRYDAAAMEANRFLGLWRNTAAITSITLLPAAGNFIAGSVFTLYGVH